MKKIIATVLIITLFSFQLYAQDKTHEKKVSVSKTEKDTTYTESVITSITEDITPRDNMLIINPLKFFLFYNLSYFHKIDEKIVIGIGVQTPTISGIDGFGFNSELRYYPSGKQMRGFYFAPNISYNHIKSDEGSTSPFSIGGLIGWQWFPSKEFALGLGIGIDYYFGSVNTKNDFEKYDGSVPAIRLDIGYAW